MIIYNETENQYGIEALCREFLRGGELSVSEKSDFDPDEDGFIKVEKIGDRVRATASDNSETTMEESNENCTPKDVQKLLFTVMSRVFKMGPEWGILVGVRPVKLTISLLCQGYTPKETKEKLISDYLISENKADLLLETAKAEIDIIKTSRENSFSMYISIPFCPSRCSYCSFTSQGIEKAKKLIPEYAELLCKELCDTAKTAKELGLRLESVYMGGGTPTTLSSQQLEKVLSTVWENFDMENVSEITVEAGRPDTITPEKLAVMRKYGVGRISINPQTMNDEVLKNIGRNHTAKDIVDCYETAKGYGFDSINMDLISGLPGDTPESFRDTVEKVLLLSPENITLHTLTLKHGANLKPEQKKYLAQSVYEMNEYAYKRFRESGYHPYYLYRQKGSVENLENVGFCKEGKEGIYNIFIMDETHTILSTGAGGVTKLRDPYSGYIERISNFKFPYEYIDNFKDISVRKEKITEFYSLHRP